MGLENVIDAALDAGVEKMICLSTDKAVYPINAMGMSKAMGEKVVVAKARHLNGSGTMLCSTRYGNVMASRGSVIPLFVDQIKAGQTTDHHRSEHDPVHDDPGRCSGTGDVCV